jgi:hypothetical protein
MGLGVETYFVFSFLSKEFAHIYNEIFYGLWRLRPAAVVV